MKSKVLVGMKLMAAVAGMVAAMVVPAVHAEEMSAAGDTSGLSMNLEPVRHKFMRFSYIYIKPNTKTSPTKDLTGPVISYADANCLGSFGCGVSTVSQPFAAFAFGQVVKGAMDNDATQVNGIRAQGAGIGLPTGLSADAKGSGSLAISAGVFFDDDHRWSTELYVFALPFDSVVAGGGNVTEQDVAGNVTAVRPNHLSGKSIIKTKELPPTAVFSYYFNGKNSAFRPFLGLGITYAMFFNTQATAELEAYSGGPTDVKIKNAFGAGPFAGLQYRLSDNWHLAAQFGYVKLKTSATLTTKTDAGALVNSSVLYDYSGYVGYTQRNVINSGGMNQIASGLAALQNYRGGSLGTYVRAMDTKLDPYIMTLSLGYDF